MVILHRLLRSLAALEMSPRSIQKPRSRERAAFCRCLFRRGWGSRAPEDLAGSRQCPRYVIAKRAFIAAAGPRFRDALIFAAVMVCGAGTVSCDDGPASQFSCRVTRHGCAPDAKALLVIAVQQSSEKLSGFDTVSLVCEYSLIDGSMKPAPDPPSFRDVFDVAFHPSERMLALSDSAGIGLYTWTEASKRWRGLPATCPMEHYYTTLSWSPTTGKWLAARCVRYSEDPPPPTSVLAIYDRADRSCTITDVPYSYGRAIWADESTVLVPSEESVAAVRAKGDDWDVVTRYEKISGSTFLGRFNGEIVQAHGGKVLLGKTVIGVRSSRSPLWTLVTDRYIYLCESPSVMKVLGHEGEIVATGNPGGSVRFGCAGGTDDIVYGIFEDKWLVRVKLTPPTFAMERLADLSQEVPRALEH